MLRRLAWLFPAGNTGCKDIAIAATADAKVLTLPTCNVKDFAPMGVDLLDPYERPPSHIQG